MPAGWGKRIKRDEGSWGRRTLRGDASRGKFYGVSWGGGNLGECNVIVGELGGVGEISWTREGRGRGGE